MARIGVVSRGPLQTLLIAASMVACINAIVGGVPVALALRWLLEGSVAMAAVTGVAVALTFVALSYGYQVRCFRRAAGVVPELYQGAEVSRTCLDGPSPQGREKRSLGVHNVDAGRNSSAGGDAQQARWATGHCQLCVAALQRSKLLGRW